MREPKAAEARMSINDRKAVESASMNAAQPPVIPTLM